MMLSSSSVYATHNRAGEIIYEKISGLTYRVTVITYTVESSIHADRPEIDLFWGDGSVETVLRSNGPVNGNGERLGVVLEDDVKRNEYTATHTYAGPSTYTISFEDQNRNAGVKNMFNSVNLSFFVESTLVINPFVGENRSPELLYPPLDRACITELFVHNPGVYDADGDSITYTLIPNKAEGGDDVPGYTFLGATIDATGTFTWTPTETGEYNFAILIEEWRNGIFLGSILRDLQVIVFNCDNDPPVLNVPSPHCLIAGDTLEFNVSATDSESAQEINLSAVSGIFEISNPATFPNVQGFGQVEGDLYWETNCNHIRNSDYSILFTATDNGTPVELSSQSTAEVRVVAPPLIIDTIIPQGINPVIYWSASDCDNIVGYRLYKGDYFNYLPDDCETGVPAYTGYELLATLTAEELLYEDVLDQDVLDDRSCYMVIAYYADGSESIASNEYCFEFTKSVPVITNVSVLNTSVDTGKIEVKWTQPFEIDSILTPGPFEYNLIRRNSAGEEVIVFESSELTDTTYVDSLLNTQDQKYSYRVEFFNRTVGNDFIIGTSRIANSLYLNIDETDQTLILYLDENVPWTNNQYRVYLEDPIDSDNFVLVDSSFNDTIVIDTLNNLQRYGYRIESVGGYLADYLPSPLENFSQKQYGTPLDTIPPCLPSFEVDHDCIESFNNLSWLLDSSCASDIDYYNIYYKAFLDAEFELIETVQVESELAFSHNNLNSVAGCYYITGVDTFANETLIRGNGQCFDNCPVYELPNVFTPNTSFVPFPHQYIESISIKIYNRWGNLVQEYEGGPDFSWDGTEMLNNQRVSDGVYFYVCQVNEIRLSGIVPRQIKGYVQVLSSLKSNQNQ